MNSDAVADRPASSDDPRGDAGRTGGSVGRVVLVSGPSGAGRSTALAALEDLGCETIDNIPLSLVPRLMEGPALAGTLVLGLDVRNRDFSVAALLDLLDWLAATGRMPELVYLDARPDILLQRYSETRRRHPLAPAESPQQGIERELDLLSPVRLRADLLIDTSTLTPHDLKAELARWFDPAGAQQMAVMIHSFSYKRGMPRGLDMVFDCRFLSNPYWDPALRGRNGLDPSVAAFVAGDGRYAPFFEKVNDLVAFLLPAYSAEGKSYLSVGFGCTGGQHRSVATAAALADALESAGWNVSLRHHELERTTARQGAQHGAKPGRDHGPKGDGTDR
ncbi:RNase adapter RapZ [Meridianimarinicoccus sp. RP-17]|uniref:RNase adapter RapZ n=1 Tax=Meridianimarinicoccus zhengii TaxID=2056810 RepID=UPI000DAF039F|nr:RNase adapter RapZ [Phycocomes zhengii]